MKFKMTGQPISSSGVLLSGLGQGLVQFADTYGSTKYATLDAEAARNKESRLMQMDFMKSDMANAWKMADLNNSEERLQLARNADARADRTATIADAKEKRAVDTYNTALESPDWEKATIQEVVQVPNPDPVLKNLQPFITETIDVPIVYNKKDPSQILRLDGKNAVDQKSQPVIDEVTDDVSEGIFKDRENAIDEFKYRLKVVDGVEMSRKEVGKIVDDLVSNGVIKFGNSSEEKTSSEIVAPPSEVVTEDNLSPDAQGTYPEFQGDDSPADAAWYTKQIVPSDPTLSDVGEWISKSAQDDNPQHNEMFAKSLGLPGDIVTSVINNVLMPKGSPIETPIGGSKWLMENKGLTIAQLVGMIKESAPSGGDTLDSDSAASPDATTTPDGLPIVTDGGAGVGYQGLMRQMESNAMEATQESAPVTSPDATATYPEFGAIAQPAVFDPSDGMGVNTAGGLPSMPATGVSVSDPTYPTGLMSDQMLGSINDPVRTSEEGYGPYTPPENSDMQYPQAKQQISTMVDAMVASNIPEDIIREELLSMIQEIPQEQANSPYAQAIVDVFNSLFGN
jgi:hypothetical protein